MAKNKKSKILASVLAVSTMAVFYAAPVFAAQEGLTTLDGENIKAESTVSINGVTLSGNDLSAVDGAFTGNVSGKTGTFTGAVTAKGFTSNNGAIYVKNTDNTTVFTADTKGNVTAVGKLTANNGSSVTATSVGSKQATSAVSAGSIANTTKVWDADNEKWVNAAGSSIGTTSVTDTVYDAEGKTASQMQLTQGAATLKSGSASVSINGTTGAVSISTRKADGYGTFSVTSNNFNINSSSMAYKNAEGTSVFTVSNAGNVTAAGKLTANNGSSVTATANENKKAASSVGAGSITNTTQVWDADNEKWVNAAGSSIGTTTITDTVYNAEGKVASQMSLNQTSASLKSGSAGVTVNGQTGAIGITAKASDGTEGALTVTSSNFDTAATATTVTAVSGTNSASSKTAYNEIEDTITNGTNTTTSTMNANGITDSFTTDTVTASSTMNAKGITDTFTDANGTHSVTTDGNGTKFTGPTTDNRYNYTTIDGNTATFGGSTSATYGGQTVISGGSVTTDSVTTDSLTIDENNGWTEDGLTIDGVTVTTKDGSLAVGALAIDNVQLDETGLKLGETGNEKFTVDSATGETHINGTYGSLNMKDIGESTMIYTKADDENGTNTIWIDTAKGNINTIGTIGVGKDLANPTTIINSNGDIAVGITGINEQKIHLNASEGTITAQGGFSAANGQFEVNKTDGSVKAANINGVTLATNGEQVLVGNYDVAEMSSNIETNATNITNASNDLEVVEGNVGGIRRAQSGDYTSTYIEEAVRVNNKGGLAVLGEDGNAVAGIDRSGRANFTALTVDGGITSGGALTVKNENGTASLSSTALNIGNAAIIRNDGIARFGALDSANVRVENGVLTVNSTGENDVAKLDAEGLTLTSGATEATLSAEQIARLNKVVTQNGDSVVVTGDYFKNTNESFAVDGNGAVKAANGKFAVGADGDVAIQYAADGAIVANENGFAVQKGEAQTVVTNDGVANVYGDNSVNVNANGVGLAAGLKADGSAAAQISVTDDGIGLQGGTSEVVLNSNNGAVFTNGEGNGETVINGGNITTNRITTGTVNGVAIGMNDDGDITLGDNVVIDGDFNSDNIAGITRVDLNDSEPGSEVTYIEKNTAVSADGIVVTDPNTGVSTKTKYDGFYVKDETGNNVSSLTKDRLILAGEKLAVADSEGNIDVSASTYTAGDVTAENVRVKSDGIYVKNGSEILNSLTAEGLTLGEEQLTEEKIADIGGIDRTGNEEEGYNTTIEGVLNVSDDGSISAQYADDGAIVANENGFAVQKGEAQTVVTNNGVANVYENNSVNVNAEGVGLAAGMNADGSAAAQISVTDKGIGLQGGTSEVVLNSNYGAVFTNGEGNGETVINGSSVTTGTITADDLHVDNIYLGNQIVDEEGNVIGSDLTIGADGSIKIADNFEVDQDNLAAHYGDYDLTLDGTNGFALANNTSSLTLSSSGYAFDGPVYLGAGSDVSFTYAKGTANEKGYTLDSLVDKVNDIYNRTDGIYKDAEGNTVISNEQGKWNEETKQTEYEGTGSKVTIGEDGATFENGAENGITNVNGGTVNTDAALVGDHDGTAGGGAGTGATGNGTVTNSTVHSGQFSDADSSFNFEANADGFTATAENANGNANVAISGDGIVTGVESADGNNSAGLNITDEGITSAVKDGNNINISQQTGDKSSTIITDGTNTSSIVQDVTGVTVETGKGTASITGNDVVVTDKETGKDIAMSDIGHVEDIDSEIQNAEGNTTVVDAVNNEAQIRRDEISRVDGRIDSLEERVSDVEERIDKVGAMAAAIANLRSMGYDPAAPTEIAVGIGQYRDETGAALGFFHYPNRDFMLSLSVATSGDEVMGGIGATWRFGRKSPEKAAEIEKAKKAEEIKRAAAKKRVAEESTETAAKVPQKSLANRGMSIYRR